MKVLLITPPFTQLNTAYPATAYLKGFFNTLGVASLQVDLSLETTLALFSGKNLKEMFSMVEEAEPELSENAFRIFGQRSRYIRTIDAVISFLQHKNPTLAGTIIAGGFLPRAQRFDQTENLQWAFGTMGTQDHARHLATLYLEDIGDFIREAIDPYFGFSRYAERIARTTTHFESLYMALKEEQPYTIGVMQKILSVHLKAYNPDLVVITMPFPGNVFAAFKCGQLVREKCPNARIAMGGGYVNTELRSIYDERVFEFTDFITLDDGEAPLQHIIQYMNGERTQETLKRTFCLTGSNVTYINGSESLDIPQREVGTPDYRDLKLDKYISVIEVINPMHRLWSDGRWNKLTLAHGCYWGKCSFCDVTLDYIKRYEPVDASVLCDRIEEIIEQTGQHGFHFVDEAAPPALMRDLAVEILRRGITVVWWTNIRFEKSFTKDLCRLLRASGCIAVSGGLEVASDRLLALMKKGVTVAQVAHVASAFSEAGIMVHTYLMYGFPTQTVQETIDSLEMVRQMFELKLIHSGFWHQFAMTAHSPVGLNPEAYHVVPDGPEFGGFADNDRYHLDPEGAEHELFSDGLRDSIFWYMQGEGLDESLHEWFSFEVPETGIPADYIEKCISETVATDFRPDKSLIWIGGNPVEMIIHPAKKRKGGKQEAGLAEIVICGDSGNTSLFFDEEVAGWILEIIERASPENDQILNWRSLQTSFEAQINQSFESFIHSESFGQLRLSGLVIV